MGVSKSWALEKAVELTKASLESNTGKATNKATGEATGEYLEAIFQKLLEIDTED